MKLNETENPLVTPEFIGTDEEKIQVLSYWSELIGTLRSLNAAVISHPNKLAILAQLKAETELLEREVTNVSATAQGGADGAVELSQAPAPNTPAPENVVNLAEPERIPATEMMMRLSGTWYGRKKK